MISRIGRKHGAPALLSAMVLVLIAHDLAPSVARAQTLPTDRFEFVTLGTQGGPSASATRSQPANVLVRPGEAYLIDVGDGTAGRLAAAHVPIQWIRGIFISHLHFDHIGGLFAILGLRHQMNDNMRLAIYGPPGTKETVAGLFAAMQPSVAEGYGLPGERTFPPQTNIEIHELNDHSVAKLNGFVVSTAVNTHFSYAPGTDMDKRYKSLSYRLDLPERSIVYTGDTGPSRAVEKLAFKADLLVTELVDPPAVLSGIRQQGLPLNTQDAAELTLHLNTQHLTTEQVGQLAQRAMVGAVVVTHLASGGSPDPGATARYVSEIRQQFPGNVVVANDLDRF